MPFHGKRKWSVWKGEVKRLLEAGTQVTWWIGSEDWEEEGRRSCQRLLFQENKIRERQWTGQGTGQGRFGGEYAVIPKANIVRGRIGGALRAGTPHPLSSVRLPAGSHLQALNNVITAPFHLSLGALKSILPESLGR